MAAQPQQRRDRLGRFAPGRRAQPAAALRGAVVDAVRDEHDPNARERAAARERVLASLSPRTRAVFEGASPQERDRILRRAAAKRAAAWRLLADRLSEAAS